MRPEIASQTQQADAKNHVSKVPNQGPYAFCLCWNPLTARQHKSHSERQVNAVSVAFEQSFAWCHPCNLAYVASRKHDRIAAFCGRESDMTEDISRDIMRDIERKAAW